MNDIVSVAATARSPALHQIYDTIATSAHDADRIHLHEALALLRQARFGALNPPGG